MTLQPQKVVCLKVLDDWDGVGDDCLIANCFRSVLAKII